MHGVRAKDGDREIDWGATSSDYARWRPAYPASLFARLAAHGVGVPGQRVLDLGTGVGFLAREWARRGCHVSAVDVAENQVRQGRRAAEAEGLEIDFRTGPAEAFEAPPGSLDLITAGQCWLYFDRERMIPLVHRLLAPGGRLVTCHFSWLPRLDPVARASEQLVLAHNPDWSAADWSGEVPPEPGWASPGFQVATFFWYDEPVEFTRESWRGRIRASRGIGAALSPAEIRRFDEEHAQMLERMVPERFEVLHRVDAHVFAPAEGE